MQLRRHVMRRTEESQKDWRQWREARAVEAFLTQNRFQSVTAQRRRLLFQNQYALHAAVRANDTLTVQLLLKAGADPSQTDYKVRTPGQLARQRDVSGSHAEITRLLSGQSN